MKRIDSEIKHFTDLDHIWWGARTIAGQKRYDKRFKLFKKTCNPQKASKILEIGCGDGEFTKRLARLDSQIIGTDVTPEVIKRAQKSFKKKKVKFTVDDAEKMQFKSGSFDIVCGISILHHVDTKDTLKECWRVLKKDGQIFFSEPNLLNPNIFVGLNTPWLREKMEYSPDEVALVRWKVEKMLKNIGFSEVSVKNYDFLHPLTPPSLIRTVSFLSNILQETPLVKEISGSLIIVAQK